MKTGRCDCPKIQYIWYDGVRPTYRCPDCKQGVTWS